MCPRTGEDEPERTFGHVARDVLRRAPCPVVLVPPRCGREAWALRRLLFPHDGTPTTAAAVAPAADLAARAGAELLVLHVATAGAARPCEAGTLVTPRYVDQPQHEWPAWGHEFVERLRGIGRLARGARIRLALAQGEPGPSIVDYATRDECDLIALAWRGGLEPGRARELCRVIRDAGCPAIVFRV
jgi:nucleotide-binding universal stress UspA family protein